MTFMIKGILTSWDVSTIDRLDFFNSTGSHSNNIQGVLFKIWKIVCVSYKTVFHVYNGYGAMEKMYSLGPPCILYCI